MADFFDSKLLRFLVAPSRNSFMSVTSRSFLSLADRVLGKRFLEDITDFFVALDGMRPGFIARAEQVRTLLRSDDSTFVVVTTLEPAPRAEAMSFIAQLEVRQLPLGGVVCNRVLPSALLDPMALQAAEAVRSPKAVEALAERLTADQFPVDSGLVQQVVNELSSNFDRFHRLAVHENAQFEALSADAEAAVVVPWFEDDLHTLAALSRSGAMIWGTP
jgi:anion-transporting  ArsA/GET3 family ATPase